MLESLLKMAKLGPNMHGNVMFQTMNNWLHWTKLKFIVKDKILKIN
jgi:hypothetical protein